MPWAFGLRRSSSLDKTLKKRWRLKFSFYKIDWRDGGLGFDYYFERGDYLWLSVEVGPLKFSLIYYYY